MCMSWLHAPTVDVNDKADFSFIYFIPIAINDRYWANGIVAALK